MNAEAMPLWASTEVSRMARESSLPREGSKRRRILEALAAFPSTDDELEKALGMSHQSLSAARRGLVKDGHVEASGDLRKTSSGSMAQVWRVSFTAGDRMRRRTT